MAAKRDARQPSLSGGHDFRGSQRRRYWAIFRIQRAHIKSDFIALVWLLILIAPVSYLPNILLANALFGDVQQALALLVRPLPGWAAVAAVPIRL